MKRYLILFVVFFLTISVGIQKASAAPSRPMVLITEINTQPAPLMPGNEFLLELKLHNAGNKYAKKVTLTISSSASQSNAQEMVMFSPIESGNVLYIDEIKTGATMNVSIKMMVPGDMKPGVYNLNIKLAYGDSGRASYEEIQTIGLIVAEKDPLKLISLKYPTSMRKGDMGEISAEIVNLGNAPLQGINVELKGDISAQERSLYLGTFEPGDSDMFSTQIQAEKSGTIKGELVVSYYDSFKQRRTVAERISINVLEESAVEENREDNSSVWASIVRFFRMLVGLGGK